MSYETFSLWMKKIQTTDDDSELLSLYKLIEKISPKTFYNYTLKYHESNKPKPILYQLFTFTTAPAKQNSVAQEDYIKSILKRKDNLQLTSLWYCIEHKDTNLHYHVGLGSYKSIPPDAFKQYKQNFGNVNKSRKITLNSDGSSDYTNKENTSIKLL